MWYFEPECLGELVCPVVLACRSAQVGGAKAGQEQGQEEIENLNINFLQLTTNI